MSTNWMIKETFSWRDPSYFVNRVVGQDGRSICSICAVTYLLEFFYSSQAKFPAPLSVEYLVEKYYDPKTEKECKIGDILLELPNKDLSVYDSPPQEELLGRHAIFVIGYRKIRKASNPLLEETHLLVKNSWTADWGHEGFAWVNVSRPSIMKFGGEVYTITPV